MKKSTLTFVLLLSAVLVSRATTRYEFGGNGTKDSAAVSTTPELYDDETDPSGDLMLFLSKQIRTHILGQEEESNQPEYAAIAATDTSKKKKIIIIKTEDDTKDVSEEELMKAARKLEKYGNGKVKIEKNPNSDEKVIVIEAPENENKTGDDTTIVKLGKMILKMKPKGVEMDKDTASSATSTITPKKPKAEKNIKNSWLGLDLGLCNYQQQKDLNPYMNNQLSPNKLFTLQQEKSYHIGLNIFEQRINLYQHHVNFRWGLGISWEKYRFADNLRLYTDKTNNTLVTAYDSVSFTKNKFVTRYLTLPAMIELHFGKNKSWKQFSIAGGLQVSQYFGSWQSLVSAERGKQNKIQNGSYNLSQQRVSVIGRVGLGKLAFYGSYSLTPLFNSSQQVSHYMPEMNPFNFGIRLTGL